MSTTDKDVLFLPGIHDKASWREWVLHNHPDKLGADTDKAEATRRFQIIQGAFARLHGGGGDPCESKTTATPTAAAPTSKPAASPTAAQWDNIWHNFMDGLDRSTKRPRTEGSCEAVVTRTAEKCRFPRLPQSLYCRLHAETRDRAAFVKYQDTRFARAAAGAAARLASKMK